MEVFNAVHPLLLEQVLLFTGRKKAGVWWHRVAQPWTLELTTENLGRLFEGGEFVNTTRSCFKLSCFSSSRSFTLWKQVFFFLSMKWVDISMDLQSSRKVPFRYCYKMLDQCPSNLSGWRDVRQVHLWEPSPCVGNICFSVRIPLDQLCDLKVRQFSCEGLGEQSNSMLARKEKSLWSKGAKHRCFWLLTPT